MAISRAILLEYASGQFAAIAFAHMEEALDAPLAAPVPLAPPHCDALFEWQGEWMPLFDLGLWCGAPSAQTKRYCVVISYRQNHNLRYGGLRTLSFPRVVVVDDAAAAPLPGPRWNGFARACFRHHDHVIPVLDLEALFETSAGMGELSVGCDISAFSLEEYLV